jgi:DNA-binding Xre family transcriptional regulator
MMKIKIAETAEKHGVKSAYGLQKALSISPTIAARLWKGEFDKIGIGTLEKLCEHFQCQPNDLLEYPQLRKVADGMLLFSDVCIRLNKSESSVRRYLTDKRLKGEKVKGEWQILESDVEKFERSDFFKNLK